MQEPAITSVLRLYTIWHFYSKLVLVPWFYFVTWNMFEHTIQRQDSVRCIKRSASLQWSRLLLVSTQAGCRLCSFHFKRYATSGV